jgi:hypothetical protein
MYDDICCVYFNDIYIGRPFCIGSYNYGHFLPMPLPNWLVFVAEQSDNLVGHVSDD